MTFEEAMYYSLKVPWMVEPCTNIDIDSWCVGVVPVDKIIYNTGLELEIIPFGSIDPILAQYIVRLHNEHCDKVKQCCRNAMKETMDSLIPFAHQSVTNTNNPTIDDYRTIKRKEID